MSLKNVTHVGTEDLIELFGVTRVTINNWIKRGLIPAPEKVNRVNRFPLNETLQAALDNGLKMPKDVNQLIAEYLNK